ncbi:MAG: HD domain-containing protein [Ferruginibacter sp.]
MDVTAQCMSIARDEQIQSPAVLEELEIAALYHDTGFIYVYNNHEEKGCEIAREQLPGFGLTPENIDNICALIMATKVPQLPMNELQKNNL